MKKFVRPTSPRVALRNRTVDFSQANRNVPEIFEPGVYELSIESAKSRAHGENDFADLVIIESATGARVDIRPIWFNGPNANSGDLAYRHQVLLGNLLLLAGQPPAGDPEVLLPKLAGLAFTGRLVLATDKRTGATFNALTEILDNEEMDDENSHDG